MLQTMLSVCLFIDDKLIAKVEVIGTLLWCAIGFSYHIVNRFLYPCYINFDAFCKVTSFCWLVFPVIFMIYMWKQHLSRDYHITCFIQSKTISFMDLSDQDLIPFIVNLLLVVDPSSLLSLRVIEHNNLCRIPFIGYLVSLMDGLQSI